jgi:hypothetical protein
VLRIRGDGAAEIRSKESLRIGDAGRGGRSATEPLDSGDIVPDSRHLVTFSGFVDAIIVEFSGEGSKGRSLSEMFWFST